MTETAALVNSAHAIAPNAGASLARCASNAGTLRPGKPSISSSRCPSSSPIPRPQGNTTTTSLCSRRIAKSSRRSLTLSSLPVPKSNSAHASLAGSGTSRRVSPNTVRVRTKASPAEPALDHQINSARLPLPTASLQTSLPSSRPQSVVLPLRTRASVDSLPVFQPKPPLTAVEETSPSPSSTTSDELPSQTFDTSPTSPDTSSEVAEIHSGQSSKRSSAASDDSFTANHLRLQAIEETLLNSGPTAIAETILAARTSHTNLIPFLSESSPTNDQRRPVTHRHKISLRSSLSNISLPSTPVRVPPIRGFRSSGSRKSSLILDMNVSTQQANAVDDGVANDHTLRLADDRVEHDALQVSTPTTARQSNTEDSSDIFLNIAREEAYRKAENERFYGGSYTPLSSSGRSGHRRPLSTSVAYYQQPMSPPKLARRLSDQQERPNLRNIDDDQSSQTSRSSTFRSMLREKAASSHPAEELSRARGGGVSLRQSPAPRSPVYHDDAFQQSRRRASVTESTPPVSGRQYKSAILGHGHRKTYSSSPLIQSLEGRGQQQSANLIDGTESTTSTTAPSTVWDELDDLKSRINRLELTGKLPPTSAAAVARLSDERPATATTTVTSASLSPKRQPTIQLDTQNGVSSHPLLLTALTKSKQILGPGVYQALESAAHDALGLSQMMGTAGQGPISSGASAIASGSTPSITDRQLRRKADSVCRSLTELCLALNENMTQGTAYVQPQAANDNPRATPTTPTIPRSAGGMASSRRSSITADSIPPPPGSASRVLSKYEERRSAHFSAPPISLYTNPHNPTPDSGMSRRSSLLISRTRRAQTEEPEEGRESPFLRSRRTERVDAEDGRRSSLLIRSRRGSVDQNDEPQLGSPMKVRGGHTADYSPENQTPTTETDPNGSAGPSRRFVSDFHSRVTIPAGPATTPQRRYLERGTPDREVSTRTPDFSAMRRLSLHTRNNSLGSRRVNRDSMTPSAEPTVAAE